MTDDTAPKDEKTAAEAPDAHLIEEYREVGQNWRYWGEVRFKQLTVFLTTAGALAAGALTEFLPSESDDQPSVRPEVIRLAIGLLGVLVTCLFFVLDERATFYRRAYMYRALEVERALKLSQYQVAHNIYWHRWQSERVYRLFFIAILAACVLYLQTTSWLAPSPWKMATGIMAIVLVAIGWELGSRLQWKAEALAERREYIRRPRPEPKGLIYVVRCLQRRLRRHASASAEPARDPVDDASDRTPDADEHDKQKKHHENDDHR